VLTLRDRIVVLSCLAFSPDGRLLVAGGYKGEAQVWDAAAGKLQARLPGRKHTINGVFFFDGGRRLLGYDDAVFEWELSSPGADAKEWEDTSEHTGSVAVAPDGKRVCREYTWSGPKRELICHELPSRKVLWQRDLKSRPGPLLFSPDGLLLLHAERHRVVVRETATGEERRRFEVDSTLLDRAALSPDCRTLAFPNGRNLSLWQLDPPRQIARHQSPGRTEYHSVAFHPSGEFFASANGDGAVDYWDARTGAHRQAFDWKVGKLNDVVFDPSGDRGACCSKTGHVVVWDVDR
jgi:WD40 repeat protein